MSEVGRDMTKWKTEHHFTSWLGLAPNTKKSGGKIINSKIMKKTIMQAKHLEWQPAVYIIAKAH